MKKKYIIILAIILLVALGFILSNKIHKKIDADAKRIYIQGLSDIKNNDLQNAYYNFSKVSKYSSLYEPALFRQGLAATELNDNKSAIEAYETLLGKYPYTFFSEKAIYNLAVAYYNVGEKENAYANFKLISQKYENSDYADASNYFLGVLTQEKDKKKANEYFFNYIKIAPQGRYSLDVIKNLTKLNENFTADENLQIGISLLKNEKYDDALNYLNMSKLPDAWAYLSIAYKNTGNTKVSSKIFEDGIMKYSINNSEIQEEAINEYVKLYGNRPEIGLKKAKTLCDKSKCQLNDYIMYNLLSYSDKKTKVEYYNRIYTEFPDGDYAADALFNSMFNDYTNGSYDNAIIKAKKHIQKYSDKKSAPANLYWLARTYDNKRNHQEANNYYNKVKMKYNDSYYSYLAISKLNKVDNPFEIKSDIKIPEDKIIVEFPIMYANLPLNSIKKIDDLLRIGDLKIFEYSDFENEIIKSWVAYYEEDLAKASVIADGILSDTQIKPTLDDTIYKLIYPIGYAKEINKYSVNNQIAPYLLLSLIKRESHFNKDAQSTSGATGLTQLMPETAQYIASLSNINFNKSKLKNPDFNIMLGATYYKYIKQNHHSNDLYAIASYNSGHNAVTNWINDFGSNDLDEFVEQIPYQETRDYIKQIYQYYWVYNCIYNSSTFK